LRPNLAILNLEIYAERVALKETTHVDTEKLTNNQSSSLTNGAR